MEKEEGRVGGRRGRVRWRRLVDGGGGRFSVGGSGGEGCRGERGGGGDGGVGGGGGGEHKIRRTCLVHSLGGMCPCSVHVDLHPRHPLSLSVPPLATVALRGQLGAHATLLFLPRGVSFAFVRHRDASRDNRAAILRFDPSLIADSERGHRQDVSRVLPSVPRFLSLPRIPRSDAFDHDRGKLTLLPGEHLRVRSVLGLSCARIHCP